VCSKEAKVRVQIPELLIRKWRPSPYYYKATASLQHGKW